MDRTKKILVFLLLLFSACGYAQNNPEFSVENTTYRLYTEQKWDSLANVGSEAIENGPNYFYLSYRVGFAYYMLEKYRKAIDFFNMALTFNSEDMYTLGYLYQSYILSGRNTEALLLINKLTPSQKEYFKIKSIDNISFDFGVSLSNNKLLNGKSYLLLNDTASYGMKDLTTNFNYSGIGLQHKLFNKISVNYYFSILSIDKFKQTDYIKTTAQPGGPVYEYKMDTLNYKLSQMDYYIGLSIPLKKGLIISPSFHLLSCNFTNRKSSNIFNSFNPSQAFPQLISDFKFNDVDTSFYNYAYSLSITKNYRSLSITPSLNYSTLNGKEQKGASLSVSLFPKNNLNIYSTTTLSGSMESDSNRLFINQLIGFKLSSKWWAEIHGTYGDLSNGMENNGFLVYNNADLTKYRAGFNLIYSYKHIELSFRYQIIQKQNTYQISSISPTNNFSISNTTQNSIYKNNTLIGGIKWNF